MVSMFLSVVVASVSQVLLKKSALKKYDNVIKEYLNPYVIGGYGLLFGSMLLTVYAYSGMDYKNGPVIESLGNVFVLVLGYFVFRERISFRKILGIACIMAGIVIFNL
jgi:drug/metabolite transporter (DMT)-like permease